jgi:gas vesicle protein
MNNESTGLSGAYYSDTKSTKSSDASKIIVGALAGAALGSIIGGLYTEKGIETRRNVSDRSRKFASDVKEKASDISEGIKGKVSNISGDIADKFEATKEAAVGLFKKEKRKADVSALHSDYNSYYSSEEDEISKTKVLIGVLAASVAGTLIWGLTTEKGKETRRRIGESSKSLAKDVKEKVSNIADGIAEQYNAAKEGARELLEQEDQRTGTTYGSTAYKGTTNQPDSFAP